jgi:hypothetical protein
MSIDKLPDTINTAVKVGDAVVKMPSNQRQFYRDAVNGTFEVLDSALVLIITRLESIIVIAPENQAKFIEELRNLGSVPKWREMQRNVNLCNDLRTAGREMKSRWSKIKDDLSLESKNELRDLIDKMVEGEESFAKLISESFVDLASMADDAKSPDGYVKAKEAVIKIKSDLEMEKNKLLSEEQKFLNAI